MDAAAAEEEEDDEEMEEEEKEEEEDDDDDKKEAEDNDDEEAGCCCCGLGWGCCGWCGGVGVVVLCPVWWRSGVVVVVDFNQSVTIVGYQLISVNE